MSHHDRLPDAPGTHGPPDPVEKVLTFTVTVNVDVGDDEDDAVAATARAIQRALDESLYLTGDVDVEHVGTVDA